MNRVGFVLRSRGLFNACRRTAAVARRFGSREDRFVKRVEDFQEALSPWGVRPSFPIATVLLERYPGLGAALGRLPIELLSHGYTHIDFTEEPLREQAALLERSRRILNSCGISPRGFRAPYLHWNGDTLSAARGAGFRFDSSMAAWQSVDSWFPLTGGQKEALSRAKAFYAPFFAPEDGGARPRFLEEGFLEIPVSLPDDEILIDRLGIEDADSLSRIFRGMADRIHDEEGLFTIQVHPERADLMNPVLRSVLESSSRKKPGVWVAGLGDIDAWWREKDASAFQIRRENGRTEVVFSNAVRRTLLVQSESALPGTTRWDGSFFRIAGPRFQVFGDAAPMIGLHPGAKGLEPLLRDAGFAYAPAGRRGEFSLHLDRPLPKDELLGLIRRCPGPLLRAGPWPDGNKSALCVSGDIDCVTWKDFFLRFFNGG